jgi:hypothetical protein
MAKQEEQPKKSFEIKTRLVNGGMENAIFIDGEQLDWSLDVSSLQDALKMGPKFFAAAQKDIEKHFLESVSDFLGRKITNEELKNATKQGWI